MSDFVQVHLSCSAQPLQDSTIPRDPIKQAEHYRFLKSFAVENSFYRELAEPLAEKGIVIPKAHHLPKTRPGQPYTILMEDLSERFPSGAGGMMRSMNRKEMQAALRWLASFHAAFWEEANAIDRGLHERGSYWILDGLGTLELESVKDGFAARSVFRGPASSRPETSRETEDVPHGRWQRPAIRNHSSGHAMGFLNNFHTQHRWMSPPAAALCDIHAAPDCCRKELCRIWTTLLGPNAGHTQDF